MRLLNLIAPVLWALLLLGVGGCGPVPGKREPVEAAARTEVEVELPAQAVKFEEPQPLPGSPALPGPSPERGQRPVPMADGLGGGAGSAVAQAPAPEEGDESEEKPRRSYAAYLEDPQALGFQADENLFRNVYFQIRSSFVDPVTEDQLFAGVVEEVRNLLEQAGIPAEGLATLSKDRNVLRQVVDLYGDRIDRSLLIYAATQGMLEGLGDPYSILMTPKEYARLQEQVQSREFGGIGIYIELDKDAGDRLTVFEPIEGTPAWEAGLEAGDRIMAIDGKSTDGITLDEAQAAIRGPVGTQVVLTVRRAEDQSLRDFTITRGRIRVVSVTSRLLPGRIGYLRLRLFGTYTAQELETALARLRRQGARGILLDLRNNGGGYIDAAVGVVGLFTEPGSLVVYTEDRNGQRRDYNSSAPGGVDVPVVALVNRYSASAAEITAGALRDYGLATLVGDTTFGKGSVQQLYPFPNGAALKLTTARFFTPAGAAIDHHGLEPAVKVEMEPRLVGKIDRDKQLQQALQVLQRQIASR